MPRGSRSSARRALGQAPPRNLPLRLCRLRQPQISLRETYPMSTHLRAPLPLFWPFRPARSASSGVETLDDGRRKYWVKHDVLKNVTPRMLAWWFGHFADDDVEIHGRWFSRYRLWHPLDHVYARYV